jgi:LacI family transcriptional regulator
MVERDKETLGKRKRGGAKAAKSAAAQSEASRHPAHRVAGPPVVTLKDVATAAGVSSQTVSYVMNDTGSVSETMRARIRRIASRMGYRPNRSAKAMRTGRSQTLGLIVSDIRHPFYAEFAQAVERAAAAARYAVLFVDAQGPDAETAETANRIAELQSHPVDGVISTVQSPSVLKLDVPTVVLGDTVGRRDSIAIDDFKGGEVVADYLLRLGHRHFGLVSSPLPGGIPVRREGVLSRLRAEAHVVWEYTTPPTEKVTPEVNELLARRDVSVIVCSNDMVAISVQRALWDLGLRIPDDVSVVGYDDIAWAGLTIPALTTLRIPLAEMARAAIELIIERVDAPRRRSRCLRFPVSIVERESVSSPAQRFAVAAIDA